MTNLVPANPRHPQQRKITNTERYMTARFLDQWGTPNCVSFKAFIGEYIRALERTAPDILKAAGDYLVDHHAFPMRWPTVAECRTVVHEIAEEREQRKAALMIAAPEEVPPTPEQRQRGAELIEQALASIKAGGDAMLARLAPTTATPAFTEQKYAESGAVLPLGWRDVSRNAFENRPRKLYPERKSPGLSEPRPELEDAAE
jgi:hypothetical protein